MTQKFYTSIIRRGNNILYRGYEEGLPIEKKIPYKPHVFLPSPVETEYKIFNSNRFAKRKEFESIDAFADFRETYKDVANFEIFGCSDLVRQYTASEFHGEIQWDYKQIKVWFWDIETKTENGFPKPEFADQEILLINMLDQQGMKMHIWSTSAILETCNIIQKKGTDLERFEIIFQQFDTEKEMLKDFLMFFHTTRIDVLSGWNSEGFDLPYMVNRIKGVVGNGFEKLLSPWKVVQARKYQVTETESVDTYEILGVPHLDYMEIFKKFRPGSQESWKLDHIAQVFLKKSKVSLPGDTFKETYTGSYVVNNPNDAKQSEFHQASYERFLITEALKRDNPDETLLIDLAEIEKRCQLLAISGFTYYNAIDVSLLYDLEQKMSMIRLAYQMSFMAKCGVNDVVSAMRLWESIIYNYFMDEGIVDTIDKGKNIRKQIVGAYVKEPIPKKTGWAISIDATAKYPSIIMQNNISPETIVRKENIGINDFLTGKHVGMVEDGTIMSANGLVTRKDKEGFLPILIRRVFEKRKEAKNKMLDKKKELEFIKNRLKELGANDR